MQPNLSQLKTLKVFSVILAVFNTLFAIGAILAIVSGLLLLANKDSAFFTEVTTEAATAIQNTYSPLTLLVRLVSGVAYGAIVFYCLKNRKHLPQNPKAVTPLPYLIGLVVTPAMLLYNVLTFGNELQLTAFIFPLIFMVMHGYAYSVARKCA